MDIELKQPGVADSSGNTQKPYIRHGPLILYKKLLTGAILVAVAAIALSVYFGVNLYNCRNDAADDAPAELSPVEWIQNNAYNITSVETNSTDDFSDLVFLSDLMKDVDVLWIGETNHGDGTIHSTRTRMIKYLHKCCGFNTLAFEVALFDGLAAYSEVVKLNDTTRTDEKVAEIFKKNIPMPYWGNAEETQDLFQYIAAMAPTDNPLEYTGYVRIPQQY